MRGNLNRVVIFSLQEYIARQKAAAFELAMSKMAADPVILAQCAAISKEFDVAGMDGLNSR